MSELRSVAFFVDKLSRIVNAEKMRTLSLFIPLFLSVMSWAQSIQVLDQYKSRLTSYSSSDFEGVIPFWVIDGSVYPVAEARELIKGQGKVACVSWLMNYSDNKDVTTADLQMSLLRKGHMIPLWKVVSGRPIYVDPVTDFALSFVCVGRDTEGQPIEVDSTDFVQMFSRLYKFIQ